MFISIFFSAIIYQVLIREVDRFARIHQYRMERRFHKGDNLDPHESPPNQPPPLRSADLDLEKEIKQRIIFLLALVNGGIFIASGGLGYLLAGKTLKPIKEMVDEQNRFISDASHELRTPLTALKSSMEVSLRDKNLSLEDAKKLINESIEEVNKLQLLSEELLQLTQYQKPNGNMKFEPLYIKSIVNEAIRKMAPLIKQKQVKVENKVGNEVVIGNENGLIDLFIILLDNAIKYSKQRAKIKIYSQKSDGDVFISVKDEGIGIAEKDTPHIFDRFYRADVARSKESQGGYGLGLAIAKKIVDIHHGSIEVKSAPKKGSVFIVRLPVK